MRVIVDAGPLMKFGRIDRLSLLKTMFGLVEMVPEVEVEIRRGLSHTPPKEDAAAVLEAISAGVLVVVDPVEENVASALARSGRPGHDGESKSIDLLDIIDRQGESATFITDDRGATDEAFRYVWTVKSTIHVIHMARDRGLMTEPWGCVLREMDARHDRFVGNILDDFIRHYGYDPFHQP